jgi:hypothetical protein
LIAVGWLVSIAGGLALTLLPGFHSPSGNIRCYVTSHTLRCEIKRASYSADLQARCMRPDGSGVDWHGFELGSAGKAAVTCSGGVLYDIGRQRPVFANLPYGRTWRRGGFTCTSRVTGVTCRNGGGHGLFISRASWRAW